MSRSQRRYQREVLIARLRRIWRDCWHGQGNRRPHAAQKEADHPDECRHWFCRNPRHAMKSREERLTLREQRQLAREEDEE